MQSSLCLVLGNRCFMSFHFYLRLQPIIFTIVYIHAYSTKFNLIHRFKKEHNSVCPMRRKETFTMEIKSNTSHERIGRKTIASLLDLYYCFSNKIYWCASPKICSLVIEHGFAHLFFQEDYCFVSLLPPASANPISNSCPSVMNLT